MEGVAFMLNIRRLFNKDKNIGNSLIDNSSIKVIIAGCISIIMALLIMSIIIIAIVSNAVTKKLKNVDLKNMAHSVAATIEGRINRAVDAALLLSNDSDTEKWIKSYDRDETSGYDVKGKMRDIVNSLGFDTAFITSVLTNNYWTSNKGGVYLLDVVSESDMNDKWFFNSRKMKKKYEINIDYNKELDDTFVWINSLVGDINNPIAICGTGMNLDEVTSDLIKEDTQLNFKNNTWLVDKNGVIYLSKNHNDIEKNISEYLPEKLLSQIYSDSGEEDDEFYISEYTGKNGSLYDLVYKNISNTDWRLIIQIKRSDSLSFLNAIIFNTVISGILIIVIIILLFNLLSNRLANPYKRALALNEKLEKMIDERTHELKDKNLKIQDSIDYAKRIQLTLLPSEQDIKNILKDCFVIWEPRDTVGGDFYWIKSFSDGYLLIVGDCTGHGVPGALMTASVNAMINHVTEEKCHNDPKMVLEELNIKLDQSFNTNGELNTINDGFDAGVLFVSNDGKVIFSGARLSVYVNDYTGIYEIKGSRDTIECIKNERNKNFVNHEIKYEKDICLYITTDGYNDQPGGVKGLPFGKTRLKKVLKSVEELAMSEQREPLCSAFND